MVMDAETLNIAKRTAQSIINDGIIHDDDLFTQLTGKLKQAIEDPEARYLLDKLEHIKSIPMDRDKRGRRTFPGILWLLPICFGLLGGIIAALIADMKYHASWWELLITGLVLTFLVVLIYLLIFAATFS
jgi:hypothetical protein